MKLNTALRREYQELLDTCEPRTYTNARIDMILGDINANGFRYRAVAREVGSTPWLVVGLIHCMEASFSWGKHLHNGDPLNARTVQKPEGRPKTGEPPFTWEESAIDALRGQNLHRRTDWSVPVILHLLEGYNGWGYRQHHHPEKTAAGVIVGGGKADGTISPYLWAGSNHYEKGKYIRDGSYSATAVSSQIGAGLLLSEMQKRDARLTDLLPASSETPGSGTPLLAFGDRTYAKGLQRWLNTHPSIHLNVDGDPGNKTSEAFKVVTGRFLPGDERQTGA